MLHLAAGAFAGPGDEVLYVRYGFSVYPIAARRVGATPVEAADRDYATDVDALLAAVTPSARASSSSPIPTTRPAPIRREARSRGSMPGCPPTACWWSTRPIPNISIRRTTTARSTLARTAPNVLVTRTFSKIFGLAAERIGWGYGPAEVIEAMHKIRAPFNVTTGGQAAAIAGARRRADFVEASRAHNADGAAGSRARSPALGNAGLRAVPSKANFVLVLFEGELTAEQAYTALMERGFIVRWLPGQGLRHGLRITIGTEDADARRSSRRCARSWARGLMLPFARVSVIGLGLIGSSIARAVRDTMPTVRLSGHDADPAVRARVAELGLVDDLADTRGRGGDRCRSDHPVRAARRDRRGRRARSPPTSPADAVVSRRRLVQGGGAGRIARGAARPPRSSPRIRSRAPSIAGPDAGFASLFQGRWCIVTPPERRRSDRRSTRVDANSGGGSARTSRRWTPRITTACSRSPAICRI